MQAGATTPITHERVSVIGAGLAGSECALQLAGRGIPVDLFEQKPEVMSPAHHSTYFAELVCSNSLKSTKEDSCAGLLKWELTQMGSKLLPIAYEHAVPAGGALAVEREGFSAAVTEAIKEHPLITIHEEEVRALPEGHAVIAAGPLCSDALFAALSERVGSERMSFFDAAAPIVDALSLDRSVVFAQSRYEEGGAGDYLNCPFTKEEYEAFIDELLAAKKHISKDFEEKDLFQACQPIEEIARKGRDAPRFGPMKPVGLIDPRTGKRPWAAVQLRAENTYKTSYNIVGFQTNLTWPEQKRVFSMIPGLAEAEFVRYGVMHRNSFIDAPHALETGFKIPGTQIHLAGQITGTEGYVEAIATGLYAALCVHAEILGAALPVLPQTGALGALLAYAQDPQTQDYQPMHVNFGIVPPLETSIRSKAERRAALVKRAYQDMQVFIDQRSDLFGAEQHG